MIKKAKDDLQSVTARFPAALLKRMDQWGKRNGLVKRSDCMRMLLTAALDAADPKNAAPAWQVQLEQLAGRLNTDAAGAVEVLAEYLNQPDEPAPPAAEPAKPAGKPRKLRSLFTF